MQVEIKNVGKIAGETTWNVTVNGEQNGSIAAEKAYGRTMGYNASINEHGFAHGRNEAFFSARDYGSALAALNAAKTWVNGRAVTADSDMSPCAGFTSELQREALDQAVRNAQGLVCPRFKSTFDLLVRAGLLKPVSGYTGQITEAGRIMLNEANAEDKAAETARCDHDCTMIAREFSNVTGEDTEVQPYGDSPRVYIAYFADNPESIIDAAAVIEGATIGELGIIVDSRK